MDRAHFYCWANKLGTVTDASGELCVAGNYKPAWTVHSKTYPVAGPWPEKLWKAYKLSTEVYEDYLHLCRDGLPSRKRNLEAFVQWSDERALGKRQKERMDRMLANPSLFQPYGDVPQALAWLALFQRDSFRYPFLLAHAPSRCGKTLWACSLFKNPLKVEIGQLMHFPARMRELDRKVHDGLVLDDCRDLAFLDLHQEKLQGNGVVELASSPCGKEAFKKDLFCLPIVVTVNNDTKHLEYLRSKDFLSDRENVVVLSFSGRPGVVAPASEVPC